MCATVVRELLDSRGSPNRLARRLDGDVEVNGVHDTVALKLHPDAVHPGARKNDSELGDRPDLHRDRMRVHQID